MDVLVQIQQLVAAGNYILRNHPLDGVLDGEFSEIDIECCVLGGKISKSERDEREEAIDGMKHTIMGPDHAGLSFGVVGKTVQFDDGRYYVVITAFKDQRS